MPAGSRLVTVGCLAGIAPTVADKFHSIPLKVDRLTELDRLIGATVPLATVPDQNLVETRLQASHALAERTKPPEGHAQRPRRDTAPDTLGSAPLGPSGPQVP